MFALSRLSMMVVAMALTFSCAIAEEKEKQKINEQEARAAMLVMDREQKLVSPYQNCPVDIFRKDATLRGLLLAKEKVDEALCASRPGECLSACLTGRSANHCFRLAWRSRMRRRSSRLAIHKCCLRAPARSERRRDAPIARPICATTWTKAIRFSA